MILDTVITNPSPEQRRIALGEALKSIDKRFGTGSVMRLGDAEATRVSTIPTGNLQLDLALGIGGLPRGRVVEVYGPESSGKTTLALHAIAEAQALGGTAAFIDAEHALDVEYARKLGVDVDDLLVAQPDHGEAALEITESLVRSGAVDIVVIDSVAALVPRAEIEGDMGDAHMGVQARLMSQALRKITGVIARTGTIVLFINQIRQKIGVTWGSNEVTTGGNALKFYASMRIDIRRTGAIKNGKGDVLGNKVKIKVQKNKLAPPFQRVDTEILYGKGFCKAGSIIDMAEGTGVIQKNGSWYSMGDERLGQGKENVRDKMYDEPELLAHIEKLVREIVFPSIGDPPTPEA